MIVPYNQEIHRQEPDGDPMLDQCWAAVYDVAPTLNQHLIIAAISAVVQVCALCVALCVFHGQLFRDEHDKYVKRRRVGDPQD